MDDFQTSTKNSLLPRRTYLITYSQADLTKFPTRKSFGKSLKNAFNNSSGKVRVTHWACCIEDHIDGGKHYHACLKLSGPKRWKSVKDAMKNEHNIVVHFSDHHDNYYSAYKYVTKQDADVFHSKRHPNLKDVSSPRTKISTKAYRQSRKRTSADNEKTKQTNNKSEKTKKIKRLSNLEVSEFILNNKIQREKELFAAANTRKNEGQNDLANFVLSKSPRALLDLIENTWKMENSSKDLQREKTKRIDLIRETSTKECVPECKKQWLKCALEVLKFNRIHPTVFAAAVRDAFIRGRGKFRNVIIVGPANCGKTFMLKPIEGIFKVFSNPAIDKYAWIGADEAEVIVLQDFRWNSELIPWDKLLLLLEGEIVKLPSPKNQFSSDICIEHDTPIFATSKEKVEYVGKFNSRDSRETEMMEIRWKVFEFTHRIPESDQKCLAPCTRCFSELILTDEHLGE